MAILVTVNKLHKALQMRVEKTKLVVEPGVGRNSRLARPVYHQFNRIARLIGVEAGIIFPLLLEGRPAPGVPQKPPEIWYPIINLLITPQVQLSALARTDSPSTPQVAFKTSTSPR